MILFDIFLLFDVEDVEGGVGGSSFFWFQQRCPFCAWKTVTTLWMTLYKSMFENNDIENFLS